MSKSFFCYRQLAKLRTVRGIRLYIRLSGQSVTIKLMHVFMVAGWWVTVDFESKYKIVWDKNWGHGVPIHEKKLSAKQ